MVKGIADKQTGQTDSIIYVLHVRLRQLYMIRSEMSPATAVDTVLFPSFQAPMLNVMLKFRVCLLQILTLEYQVWSTNYQTSLERIGKTL